MQGECAHAVDVGDDLDTADHRSQIARDRRLEGEERNAFSSQTTREVGDLVVLVDHLLGEAEVGGE